MDQRQPATWLEPRARNPDPIGQRCVFAIGGLAPGILGARSFACTEIGRVGDHMIKLHLP